MHKLTGKIYWFEGNLTHVTREFNTKCLVTTITDVIIERKSIKFDWQGNQDLFGGFVKLLQQEGSRFSGQGRINDDPYPIQINAELFQSDECYLIKGTWLEGGDDFTWFAEVTKAKTDLTHVSE